MTYEKILTLGKRCTSYLKDYGRKSVLKTKPILKAPKADSLGYVCPDGTINFGSEKSALSYAKNRAISALNSSNPYERTIIVSKNRILDEFSGDNTMGGFIDMRKYKKLKENISVYHGHPDLNGLGVTTPLSLNDYKVLKQYGDNVDEIVAFNSIGEFSKLENIQQPNWLPDWLQKYRRLWQNNYCESSFRKQIFGSIDKQVKELSEKIRQIIQSDDINFEEIGRITEEINKLAENTQTSREGINTIHKFWLNATKNHKFGIKYSTNFSHLNQ